MYKFLSHREESQLIDAFAAKLVDEYPDVKMEALGILSAQLLNFRSRSSAILDDSSEPSSCPATPAVTSPLPRLTRVYATGGASANRTILSLMADILSAPVCKNVEYNPETEKWSDAHWNSCSVGMAYKARWGYERHHAEGERKWIKFDDLVDECRSARKAARSSKAVEIDQEEEGIRAVAQPGEGRGAWERSVEWWQSLEDRAMGGE